ncbi:MAG: hypothetical protein NZL87_01905 [Thermomicrobium sp.]|nr:hypothetical protein [Thermomicrobium sp.]MDW7981551.1 hypothetical protein [Thermomicrobium sp.]
MRRRANQLWLLFFLSGTTLVLADLVVTRVFDLERSGVISPVLASLGIVLLLLSLLTQLRFPRRQRSRQE